MNTEFRKIRFGSKSESETTIQTPTVKKHTHRATRFIVVFFSIILLLGLISFFAIVLPVKDIYGEFQKTATIATEAYAAIKSQNIEAAQPKLKELEASLNRVQDKAARLHWLHRVPVIGNYQNDLEHFITAGIVGVQAGEITVETLTPYADLLGLKGKSTFVSGSADDRIKLAVETLDKVTPKLEDIAVKIAIAGNELDKIDAQRYPDRVGKNQIRSKIILVKDIFSQTAKLFVDAQPFLKRLPDVLGNQDSRTYLVLFQNDAELRATGGFITAYALFKVDKGKMQVIKADDIYKLDESKNKKYPAPTPILKYHLNVSNFNLRDNNLSPDYTESMKSFESMLTESVAGFPKFNGIIALDTHVLVSAIRILGDFNVYGRVFSAENDKRCDCPKAIYELEDYSTKPVAYVREERKDIIGVLLYQIMQKALGVSPSQYWGRLFQMFLNEMQQKHILLYFHDEEAQKGIDALNFSDKITSFDGDYLHINNVNFAGAKSNLFVKSKVQQDIEIGNDGSITKTITIEYKNPAPASNCNLEAGQLCLNGILRNWLRVYVPKGSTLIELKGSEKETQTYTELDKTVFEGFFTVKPQGNTIINLKYVLPFKADRNKQYKLLIQKQAGTDEDEYQISYNKHQVEDVKLSSDKIVTFKL